MCWGNRVKPAKAKRLNKLIRRAGSGLVMELDSQVNVAGEMMLCKLAGILETTSHPLHCILNTKQSSISRRLRSLMYSTLCHRSFISKRLVSPKCSIGAPLARD